MSYVTTDNDLLDFYCWFLSMFCMLLFISSRIVNIKYLDNTNLVVSTEGPLVPNLDTYDGLYVRVNN